MKTICLLFALVLTVSFTFAQSKSGIVVTFDSKDHVIKKQNDVIQSTLKLKATKDQLKQIKATAAKYVNFSVFTFTDEPDAQGNYVCVIKSKPNKDNQADKDYLHKLLLDFNAEQVFVNGKSAPVKDFPTLIK